jgi:hypothetical protein
MAISFVNGYLCTSGCDESKAKRGVDPHPSTNPANTEQGGATSGAGRAEGPAVLFGGSLVGSSLGAISDAARVNPVNGAQPADPAASRSSAHAVDRLV